MGGVRKVITTNIGAAYTLTLNIEMGTAEGLYIMPRATNGGNEFTGTNITQVYIGASGTYTVNFTATTSTTQLLVEKAGSLEKYFYIDNVKVEQSTPTLNSHLVADVVNAQYYYPFGSTMKTWKADGEDYRFGFNGQEKDDEMKGNGNSLDYGARIYDSRLGRWMSLDPEAKSFAQESHYVLCSNNPIIYIDSEGEKKIVTHVYIDKITGAKTAVSVIASDELMSKPRKVLARIFGCIDKNNTNTVYDWFDINETVVHKLENGKEVSQKTTITTGKHRTTTAINNSFLADFKVDDNIENEGYGGVVWTSSMGGGAETKRGSAKVKLESIDGLLGALTGFATGLKMGSGGLKIPEELFKNAAVLEIFNVLANTIDKGSNIIGSELVAGQIAIEIASQFKYDPDKDSVESTMNHLDGTKTKKKISIRERDETFINSK